MAIPEQVQPLIIRTQQYGIFVQNKHFHSWLPDDASWLENFKTPLAQGLVSQKVKVEPWGRLAKCLRSVAGISYPSSSLLPPMLHASCAHRKKTTATQATNKLALQPVTNM